MSSIVVANDILMEITAGALTQYQTPTLADLLTALRVELGDVLEDGNSAGQWSTEELTQFLNRAKGEVELRTRCHRARVSVALATGTHTYSTAPVFQGLEASHNGVPVEVVKFDRMLGVNAWDGAAAADAPTQVFQLTGSSVRVYPPPSATGDDYPLIVQGYAVSAALVATTDTVTSIPSGFAMAALLERAKELAYRARAQNPVNVTLGAEAGARFEGLCEAIERALEVRK